MSAPVSSSTFARNAGSSTVSVSDCTMTASLSGGANCASSSMSLAVQDSTSLKVEMKPSSVVSAVGSRRPPTANATRASSSQMTMVVHGLRALIRAKRSVTGTVLYPLKWGVPGNRKYCSKLQDSKFAASIYERIEITGPAQIVERALKGTPGR